MTDIPLPKDATFAQVLEHFANDRFATGRAGCEIVSAAYGYAVCAMSLSDMHLNAQGYPMGGAIFTLADFALAVASNIGEQPTVAVSNTINYFARAKGSRLTASAQTLRSGRHMAFYQIDIHDETGIFVAQMTATCYR
jgi:acyl-CoA thioesterase